MRNNWKFKIGNWKLKSERPGHAEIFKFPISNFQFAIALALLIVFSETAVIAQDHASHKPGQQTAPSAQEPSPTITMSDEKRQLIGVRTTAAGFSTLDKQIRTVGKVEVDETRLAFVNTKIAGWVKKLFVNFTGDRVVKGQPLLSIYSPDLVTAQEEYLLALRSRTTASGGIAEVQASQQSLIDSAKRRLILWDITEEQIEALEKTGKARRK